MNPRTPLHLVLSLMILCSLSTGTTTAQTLDALESFMQSAVDDDVVVGCAAMVTRDGRTVFMQAFGDLDLEGSRSMRTDEIVQIYSMTKAITSAAAMVMAEEGKLRLDDPVTMYIPEFADIKVAQWPEGVARVPENMQLVPPRRPITIRDLILHTSGLGYTFSVEPGLQPAYSSPWETAADLETAIRGVANIPLAHQPGTRFNYGINTDVLGRVVEVAADMPFEEVLQTRIFDPLKMTETSFARPPLDRYMPVVKRNPDTGELEPSEQSLVPYERPANPALPLGGQGLHSTLNDYTRFCRMILEGGELDGKRVLSERTVEFMGRNHLGPGIETTGNRFGMGFGLEDPVETSQGPRGGDRLVWGGAASTYFFIDPEQGLTAVFFTQQFPFNGELGVQFHEAVLESFATMKPAPISNN